MKKILNYEYKRCLLEIFLFMPLGIMGGFVFKKKKVIKTLLIALMVEILITIRKIKWMLLFHIGQVFFHNLLGVFVGLSLYFLVFFLMKKRRVWNIIMCIIAPCIMLIYMPFQYVSSCTNIWGDLYKSDKINKINKELKVNCINEDFEYVMRQHEPRMYSSLTQDKIAELESLFFESVGVSEYETFFERNNTIKQLPTGGMCRKSVSTDERYVFAVERKQPRSNLAFIDMERYKKISDASEAKGSRVLQQLDKDSKIVSDVISVLGSKLNIDIEVDKIVLATFDDCTGNVHINQYFQMAKDVWNMRSYEVNIDEQSNIIMLELYDRVYYGYESLRFKDDSFLSDCYMVDNDNIVTTEEAYQRLCEGYGFIGGSSEIGVNEVVVLDSDIDIVKDDKWYLEYVYSFYIEPVYAKDGTLIDRIHVPAFKYYYK